ncbi:hypothetical protein MgSA37_03652 [Mucilaginibacter gotjawali]|uniref:Uncharacterized protein n=2 Tax=Mucilaginibacter gotjawali TaxID=1550579 RepID=A0A839SIY6_9SPHI|nr:hypothetical protein [Mucilaginibacter gotjawali]BAU55463.1 hypothetical protein MgSA37_03652 [Mucilaginibacter gotjawali]
MSAQKEVFDRFLQFISSMIAHPSMYGVSNVEGINVFIWGFLCACRNGMAKWLKRFALGLQIF